MRLPMKNRLNPEQPAPDFNIIILLTLSKTVGAYRVHPVRV
jgi:hypothetical protein